jgi:hypothetical protein
MSGPAPYTPGLDIDDWSHENRVMRANAHHKRCFSANYIIDSLHVELIEQPMHMARKMVRVLMAVKSSS